MNKDMTRLIKRIKRKEKEPYIFREHFYHLNKKIYCYKPKSSKSTYYQILYCEKRDINGCNAKVLVNSNPNDILGLCTLSSNMILISNSDFRLIQLKNHYLKK